MESFHTPPYGVFVRTDESCRITAITSDAFLDSPDGWTTIDSGHGDRFHHAQNNYLPLPLTDDRGVYRYKLEDGQVVERTPEELDADAAALPAAEPSDAELLMEIAADHEYRLCLMEMGVGDMV